MDALDEGKSLVIYPEGGIISNQPPRMVKFKEGAFRAAIQKQIPIVPVTIPFNWLILPDEKELLLRPGTIKIIFHEPIETSGMSLAETDLLKEKVYQIIDNELRIHENR
jgi:1-acyl-sn-glycerol-3-phosphate acyltransferase